MFVYPAQKIPRARYPLRGWFLQPRPPVRTKRWSPGYSVADSPASIDPVVFVWIRTLPTSLQCFRFAFHIYGDNLSARRVLRRQLPLQPLVHQVVDDVPVLQHRFHRHPSLHLSTRKPQLSSLRSLRVERTNQKTRNLLAQGPAAREVLLQALGGPGLRLERLKVSRMGSGIAAVM